MQCLQFMNQIVIPGCVTYVCHEQGCAFTGDTILIRGCGRTDFQEGNPDTLFDSVWNQILSLPENFKLFPAHDYKGRTVTSVLEEKTLNPRLTKPRQEFVKLMNELGLPYPKKIGKLYFYFGTHLRSSTKCKTLGAKDLTVKMQHCSVVQVGPKMS